MKPIKFSLIILSLNEVNYISNCLESINQFDPIEGDNEIIVVDGLSTDGTREIIQSWMKKYPNIKLIDNPQKITPVAMNLGIKQSAGEYIYFLNSHTVYPKNLLTETLDTFNKVECDNVGGISLTLSKGNSLSNKIVQAITTHRFGIGNSESYVGQKEGFVDTVHGCYKASVFSRIGLHDERLVRNQDYEINRRLIKTGGKIWQNPKIIYTYYNRASISSLLIKSYKNGLWIPWMWFLAPYSFSYRHAIPLIFVLALIGCLTIMFFSEMGFILLTGIIVPYFTLAFLAAFQQSKKYGIVTGLFLPIFFFLFHLLYGIGSIAGIIQLVFRNAPIFSKSEPWPGTGQFRAWPLNQQ